MLGLQDVTVIQIYLEELVLKELFLFQGLILVFLTLAPPRQHADFPILQAIPDFIIIQCPVRHTQLPFCMNVLLLFVEVVHPSANSF